MKEFDRFSFPRNYSGKVPLFFRKFPEKFRRKFPEISELTTLVVVQRVAVIKLRVNNRCVNGTGSFEVKIGADTTKFTNVIITRLIERWYLFGESEMTVKDETKAPSWITGIEWRVVNFSELLLETDEQKFRFGRV